MKENDSDYSPFQRFWKKLSQNPSENSKNELYGFMLHSNIPITDLGDILVEKGVKINGAGCLVDSYTKRIDNSVGMVVEMPRSKVDDNKNKTCSHGLHVGTPDFVRNHWSEDLIVLCAVNPRDIVSVPTDYNNTKMRVCRYEVIGIADKSARKEPVVKLADIIELPKLNVSLPKLKSSSKGSKTQIEQSERTASIVDLVKLSAKKVVDYVKEQTGITMGMNPKNKQSIVKKAEKILADNAPVDTVDFTGLKCKEIISILADVIGKKETAELAGKDPRRGKLIAKATPVLTAKGIKVVDKKSS